jgi:hypothetical protein
VASGASALVVLAGECDEETSLSLARSVIAAAAADLLGMASAASEAFPGEFGEDGSGRPPQLFITALAIDADAPSSRLDNGIVESMFDVTPVVRESAALVRGPFSAGGGGRPLSDEPPLSPPSQSACGLLTLRDDVNHGGVVVRGARVVACESVSDVAALIASLPLTTAPGVSGRSHSLLSISLSQEASAPRLTILRLGRANGSPRGVPHWVSMTARVLAAIESKSPHVPYAASRVTLILRDALKGRIDGSFVSVLPRATVTVTTDSLRFAARIRSVAEILATVALPVPAAPTMGSSLAAPSEQGEEDVSEAPHFALPLPSSPTADMIASASLAANEELAATSRSLFSSTLSALGQSRAECMALQERVEALVANMAAANTAKSATAQLPATKGAGAKKGRVTLGSASTTAPPLAKLPAPGVRGQLIPALSCASETAAPSTNSNAEIAALMARIASLSASNRALSATSRDFSLYREVVEASVARLQTDVTSLAAARDESIKAADELRASLSKERRALGASRRRVTELEAHVAALEAAAAGKVEATESVAAMRAALREARTAGSESLSAAVAARDSAIADAEAMRSRLRTVESALDAARRENNSLRAGQADYSRLVGSLQALETPATVVTGGDAAMARERLSTLSADAAASKSLRPPLARAATSNPKKVRSVIMSPEPEAPAPSNTPQEWDGFSLAALANSELGPTSAATFDGGLGLTGTRPPQIKNPTASLALKRPHRPAGLAQQRVKEEDASATEALAAALRSLQKRDPRLADLSAALARDMQSP